MGRGTVMGTVDRREYLSATVLDQAFLDRAASNLENKLELVIDIQTTSGYIYASDRNKYVGSTFYRALTKFPVIRRTIGEWLNPSLEFSKLQQSVSNVNGRFNNLLPGGSNFSGWVGKTIEVKVGLRDVASTYTPIFKGRVTDVGGFLRDRSNITFLARDAFDTVNQTFPTSVLTQTSFPDLEDNSIGKRVPVIYGDWTVNLSDYGADVPAYVVNGKNAGVIAFTTNLSLVVSANQNVSLDAANVVLKRGDFVYTFASGDIIVGVGNNTLQIKQSGSGGTTLIDGSAFQYTSGDEFYVRVKGKNLGAYNDNIVWQARDILMTYGGAASGDFDANWATYRDKSTPSQSALASFKSRVWIQEPQGAMEYVLSMLEQVRVECFVSRQNKFKLSTLHFDEFQANPAYKIKQWDIAMGTLAFQLDDRNFWNRAQADYSFTPSVNANTRQSSIFRCDASITQVGKAISKKVVFPNLYVENDVILNLKEMLKLASAGTEFIDMTLTSRSLLLELGQFVKVNVSMGSTILKDVPAMVRDISYDPTGLRLPVRLWSFQMLRFPGYAPGYAGMVGGSSETITEE